MSNGGMMTDTAVQVLAPSCREELLRQHPWLAEIDVSAVTKQNADVWLAERVAQYGEYHPVAPLENAR